MIGAAFGLIGLSLALGVTLALVVKAFITAKNDAGHSADLFRAQCALTDEAVGQRDAFKKELDVAQQQMAVYRVRLATAEKQRNMAQDDATRAVVEKIRAAAPKDAAGEVNKILGRPLGSTTSTPVPSGVAVTDHTGRVEIMKELK